MAGPHPHTHLHPHHASKHLEYHHVTIDGTGTKSYGTPSQYEHAVLHQLRRLHHSRTGQAAFHEFENRSHHFMKSFPMNRRKSTRSPRPKTCCTRRERGSPNAAARMGTCCSTAMASPSSARAAAAIRTSPSRR